MLVLQRSLVITLIAGIIFTGLYILWAQYDARGDVSLYTFERLLGVFGFAAICGTLIYPGQPQHGSHLWGKNDQVWHLTLGNLAFLLILLHSGFRFGGAFPMLAFGCLSFLVVSGTLGVLLTSQTPADREAHPRRSWQNFLAQYWLHLHVVLSAGLIVFSLIHILVVLYY